MRREIIVAALTGWAVAMLCMAMVFASASCGLTRDADYPEGCRDADLAKLSALHAAELVEACFYHDSLEACPIEVREPVDAKYDAAYQKWEACK